VQSQGSFFLDPLGDLKVFKWSVVTFLIGDVADQTGVPSATIRYYESIGLLNPAARSAAGYRRYTETAVDELRFVRKAQALGFSLDEVREVLKLTRAGETPCSHVLSLAHQHLAAVDERIRQLKRFRAQLAAEISKWDGEPTPTCRGLCQIIGTADATVRAVEFTPSRPSKTRKAAK